LFIDQSNSQVIVSGVPSRHERKEGTPDRRLVMSERENFADIKLRGMRERSLRSETEMAREIQLIGQQQETCLTSPLEYKLNTA